MDNHMSLRGSAFATRQNYLRGLKVLIEYYQRLPEECTVDQIKSYLVYQRDELNIASSTLNVRVCALKYYFRHIVNRLDLVKGYFTQHLKSLIQEEEFIIPRGYIETYGGLRKWRRLLYGKDWVVYTKKPFSGTKHVIDYLGRYSHRVAITNRRIKGIHGRKVIFDYKDYRNKGVTQPMVIDGKEFIRRFCLYILPPRYRKVRHYGFIANACKAKNIRLARKSLGEKQRELLNKQQRKEIAIQRLGIEHLNQCPQCKKGRMKKVMNIYVNRPPPYHLLQKIRTQNRKGQK